MKVDLYHGNCLNEMKKISDNSVDSIVTDPPYGISFMGKEWDHSVPSKEVWKECFRVLKPGGHLLAFAGTRTQHRMAVNIEDAGFEIRDMIAWVYGSGFPKSLNVSKAIDAKLLTGKSNSVALSKNEKNRPVIGTVERVVSNNRLASRGNSESGVKKNRERFHETEVKEINVTSGITNDAKKWEGWGTALKPALEPITVARKPLSEKTVADNVLKHGTGGINIDDCRIGDEERSYELKGGENLNKLSREGKGDSDDAKSVGAYGIGAKQISIGTKTVTGRFPANFIHDGSDEVLDNFPQIKSGKDVNPTQKSVSGFFGGKMDHYSSDANYGDSGSAARFFYSAKVSGKERNEGLTNTINTHPTVKPIALMRYLVKLVTPKNGTVLDPFMGSGTTGKSALQEGINFIGIELDDRYFQVAKERIEYEQNKPSLENFFD